MTEPVHWKGGLHPMTVTVIRKSGNDLLPGEWEARTEAGTKVIVREADLEPLVPEAGAA